MNSLNYFRLNNENLPLKDHRLDDRALTIGNFDGCHLGHQQLIKETLLYAESLNITPAALSFFPRPKEFFKNSKNTNNLFTENQKKIALKELGLKEFFVQSFDENFANITYQDFLKEFLEKKLSTKAIVIGSNFKFGKNRLGSSIYLKEHSKYPVTIVSTLNSKEEIISSSRIRSLLQNGKILNANKLLNRPYLIESKVIKGKQLGRTIDIPTANFLTPKQLIPKEGVYCGYVHLPKLDSKVSPIFNIRKEELLPAVVNIGKKPTIDKNNFQINIEAHILNESWDYDELYGRQIGFYFQERLRDEIKFPSVNLLKIQIQEDIKKASLIL